MPQFEFTGADPIDHFWAGHVERGDVVEFDEQPPGPWKATRKRLKRAEQHPAGTEHGSDTPDASEED